MSNIKINATPSRVQYIATASQTEFAVAFPWNTNDDINVYQRASGSTADDATDLLTEVTHYTLTGAGTASGGTMTLVTGATVGDIITIIGVDPIDRETIFNTPSRLTNTSLNKQFVDLTIYAKQLETDIEQLMLKYNNNERLDSGLIIDNTIPYLTAGGVWRKNDGNTAIEVATLPAFPVGSVGAIFSNDNRLVKTDTSAGLNNLQETGVSIDDSNNLTGLASMVVANLLYPTVDGAANQVLKTDGAGTLFFTNSGDGDVDGPAGATDNAVARFDTATGKLIQNSGVVIDDSNNVTGVASLVAAGITYPTIDGGGGQFLQTDGLGTLSFADVSSGDVTGPAGATDNAYARFDTATGKLIQDSLTTEDDTGNITTTGTLTMGSYVDMNLNAIRFDDNTGIHDENDNELLIFQRDATAANHIEVTSARANSAPSVGSAGSDTNVGLSLTTKGSGSITLNAATTLANDVTQSGGFTANFSGATTFRITHSTAPTMATGGQIAIDSVVTDFDGGVFKYYSSEEMGVVAMPIANFTTPTDGHVVSYNATNNEFELVAGGGGGLANVVEDLTPQLGGALDANAFNIGFDTGTGITDENGNEQLIFSTAASAVNYLQIRNSGTLANVSIQALGDDADIGIAYTAKGTGVHQFANDIGISSGDLTLSSGFVKFNTDARGIIDSSDNELLLFSETASAANYLTVTNAAAAAGPTISTGGSDTNVDLNITAKGTGGDINITTGSAADFNVVADNATVRLGDALGVSEFQILDSGSTEVASIDSDGNINTSGELSVASGEWIYATDLGSSAVALRFNSPTDFAVYHSAAETFTVKSTGIELFNSGLIINEFLDEDTMTSNSATALATQQSIKAYVDATAGGINNVVEDLTPQLGGDLDANLFDILFDTSTGIRDESDNEQLLFITTASAVNYLTITNAATLGSPTISSAGDDANINLTLAPKGTGSIRLGGNTSALGDLSMNSTDIRFNSGFGIRDNVDNETLIFTSTASAVNYVDITNSATGNGPTISSAGDDANVDLFITAKGTGQIELNTAVNGPSAQAVDFGSASSFKITRSATPTLAADGQIAVDTTVTDFSHGVLKYYGGEEMGVVSMPIAQFTTPSDGFVVAYNATNDEFELVSNAGGGGLNNVVEDLTPQLGGDLDANLFDILFDTATGIRDENDNEQIIFTTTASAVNHLSVTNAATAGGPTLASTGDDANVDLNISTKGTGAINLNDNLVGPTAGTIDFGAATSLEVPNSATPAVTVDGHVAIDTTVTDFSTGIMKYYSGEELGVVAMPIAQFTTPTDGHVVSYNATNDEFELVAQTGGAGINNVVEDTTPQLGGDLDANLFDILFDTATGIRDENDNEQIIFTTTASAVNYLNITNAATTNAPNITAAGDDSNIDLNLTPKGTGEVVLNGPSRLEGTLDCNANDIGIDGVTQIVEADTGTTVVEFGVTGSATHWLQLENNIGYARLGVAFNVTAGDLWLDPESTGKVIAKKAMDVEAALTVTTGGLTVTAGGATITAGNLAVNSGNITVSGTVDGRDVATDGTKLDGIESLADVTDEANVVSSLDGATLTAVTVAGTDKVLIQDVSDADNLKTVTAQSIADLGGGGLANIVEDTTPQLGANLDANAFNVAFDTATGILDENANEQLLFTTTASAVNFINITNAITANGPTLASNGSDANVDLNVDTKGTGVINLLSNVVGPSAGTVNLGASTSLEIPNSATPSVTVDGHLAIDTTVTDFSAGVLKYYSGEEMAVVALPIAELTTPTDTHVVAYNATNDEFELVAPGGGGGGTAASQAEMETATSTTVYVSPGRQQFHPSSPKVWVNFNQTGTQAIGESYNVTSITDNGVGDTTITIATDFSTATYNVVHHSTETIGSSSNEHSTLGTRAAGTCQILCNASNGSSASDHAYVGVVMFGDQ